MFFVVKKKRHSAIKPSDKTMSSLHSITKICQDYIHLNDELLVHGYAHRLARNAPMEIIYLIFLMWTALSYRDGTIFRRVRSKILTVFNLSVSIDDEIIMDQARDALCNLPIILNLKKDWDADDAARNILFSPAMIGIL